MSFERQVTELLVAIGCKAVYEQEDANSAPTVIVDFQPRINYLWPTLSLPDATTRSQELANKAYGNMQERKKQAIASIDGTMERAADRGESYSFLELPPKYQIDPEYCAEILLAVANSGYKGELFNNQLKITLPYPCKPCD